MEAKRKAGNIVTLGTITFVSLALFAFSGSACADSFRPTLSLVFPTSTLVGYSGGSICSYSALCVQGPPYPDLVSGLFVSPTEVVQAQSGSFTPVQPAGTFDLSGVLTDGAVLGGTMTVNEVAGMVTASSFTIGAPDSLTTSVIQYDGIITSPNGTAFWLLETSVATTPEPSSIALMGTAIALMGALLWFKRRTRSQRPILP